MQYFFSTIIALFYQLEIFMFYNVQINNLTFVGKKTRHMCSRVVGLRNNIN